MSFNEKCVFSPVHAGCLGAEVEYWTTDKSGTAYKAVAPWLFDKYIPDGFLKPELPAIQIEAVTRICRNAREIERDLIATRSDLEHLGELYEFDIDTYPTPRFPFDTEVYPKPRYLEIKRRVPEKRLRAGWITGLHGHYGCRSLPEAIRLLNGLRPFIPTFVALSARSPEYMGIRNGYASERMHMYMTIQTDLMPPYIESIEHLESLARDRGFDEDPGSCWWGVRINPRHGTVEVRLMDMQETPAHAAQFLALLAVVCRQILSGRRATAHKSAEAITMGIDQAARMGTTHLGHRNELLRVMAYAHGAGMSSEHGYLTDLYNRLFA